jgi:hypothetical protein
LGCRTGFVTESSFKYLSGLDAFGGDPGRGGVGHSAVHDTGSNGPAVLENFDWSVDELDPVFMFLRRHKVPKWV